MSEQNFSWWGRLLNKVGLYDLMKRMVDAGLWPNGGFNADLYKYSTGSFLIKHFVGQIGQETDFRKGYLGFGMMHYAYITLLKPEKILCIGSQQGFIPAVCALACKDAGKGSVDFVDAGKDVNEEGSWGGVGFWKKVNARLHFSPYKLNRYIKTYVMTSKQFSQKYKRKYDYIYIDADHSYEGVGRDFKLFWPRLVEGGLMSFHDINLKGLSNGEEYGVWKFWKELENSEKISVVVRDNGVGWIKKTT